MILDRNGRQVKEYDLLKIFDFCGTRRKRYYVYKWVRKIDGELKTFSLNGNNGFSCIKEGTYKAREIEIIQRGGRKEDSDL